MSERLAAEFYSRQSRVARGAAAAVSRVFAGVDPDDIPGSWRALLPRAAATVAAAELAAASQGQPYVSAVVVAAGVEAAPAGRVVASALVEPEWLRGMLMVPALRALQQIGRGRDRAEALTAARGQAALTAQTQVSFAGSEAVSVAQVAEPNVGGWVRVLQLPSCGRCAVLAGRVYKWNDGFQRHPGCDCVHRPLTVAELRKPVAADATTDPRAYFDSLSAKEQNRHFGASVADEIRGGADIGRSVSPDRVTWRSRYPRSRSLPDRKTLDHYLRTAGGDRAEALRLLREAGLLA